jgi:hypothetical protein
MTDRTAPPVLDRTRPRCQHLLGLRLPGDVHEWIRLAQARADCLAALCGRALRVSSQPLVMSGDVAGLIDRQVTTTAFEGYHRYMSGEGGPERFLLVSVSTAGASGSLRVQVWRRLRSLGALYVQHSVCLLPAREHPVREVRRLMARVRAEGGTGRVLSVTLADVREYSDVVAEFNAARDGEYAEVIERTPGLLEEIAMETARGRAAYAEVEEYEADLGRFRAWLSKITARDYFGALGRAAAEAAVARCELALAQFEAAALRVEAHEPSHGQPAAGGRARLRVVERDQVREAGA